MYVVLATIVACGTLLLALTHYYPPPTGYYMVTTDRAGPLARGAEEAASLGHRARQPIPPAALTTDAVGRGEGEAGRPFRFLHRAPLYLGCWLRWRGEGE